MRAAGKPARPSASAAASVHAAGRGVVPCPMASSRHSAIRPAPYPTTEAPYLVRASGVEQAIRAHRQAVHALASVGVGAVDNNVQGLGVPGLEAAVVGDCVAAGAGEGVGVSASVAAALMKGRRAADGLRREPQAFSTSAESQSPRLINPSCVPE